MTMNRRDFVAGGAAVTGIAAGLTPTEAVGAAEAAQMTAPNQLIPPAEVKFTLGTQLGSAVYERAEKLLRHNRTKLVSGEKVKPQWIDKGARFWYRSDGPGGHRFLLVDPTERTRKPAF